MRSYLEKALITSTAVPSVYQILQAPYQNQRGVFSNIARVDLCRQKIIRHQNGQTENMKWGVELLMQYQQEERKIITKTKTLKHTWV